MLDLFNFWMTNFKGELAALSAAFLWSLSSVVYTRVGQRIPPLELNLLKGIIAIAFLILTLLIQNQLLPVFDSAAIGLLLLSGMLGIGIGDTALFAALNLLGPRRTLLLKTLTSPLVALLALVFLQEKLTATDGCGMLLTLLGVAWVISERVSGTFDPKQHLLPGIGWAMASTFGDATGAILSRAALTQSNISPMWSTLLRLSAGVLMLLPWMLVNGRGHQEQGSTGETNHLSTTSALVKKRGGLKFAVKLSPKLLGVITITAFFSTYLGIFLQQIGLKFTAAGIAQTLGATSPLFVLPFAIWMGEEVSLRAVLGVLVALAGVWLLFKV